MNAATRAEHLQWAKQRALQYVDAGKPLQAFTSILSDCAKHPETSQHERFTLSLSDTRNLIKSPEKMREFIEGLK